MSENTNPPAAPVEVEKPAKKADEKASRYAVYDTAHLRFVGEVVDKKADATKAAKDATEATGRKHEVREV